MLVKINEHGLLQIEAETETEGYALLQWWNGFYTKKGEIRKHQTTQIEIEWLGKE